MGTGIAKKDQVWDEMLYSDLRIARDEYPGGHRYTGLVLRRKSRAGGGVCCYHWDSCYAMERMMALCLGPALRRLKGKWICHETNISGHSLVMRSLT